MSEYVLWNLLDSLVDGLWNGPRTSGVCVQPFVFGAISSSHFISCVSLINDPTLY